MIEPGAHRAHHLGGDQARRGPARHQGGGDHGVGLGEMALDDLALAAQEVLAHLAGVAPLPLAALGAAAAR